MNIVELERAAIRARYALNWIKEDIVNESDYELVDNAIRILDAALLSNSEGEYGAE